MATGKLTNTLIAAAAFESKPFEIRDSILNNFYVRVAASKVSPTKGSKTWKVDLKTVDGKRRPVTLGKFPAMSATRHAPPHRRSSLARRSRRRGSIPRSATQPWRSSPRSGSRR